MATSDLPTDRPDLSANKAVITQLIGQVLNEGRLELIDELYAHEAAAGAWAWIAPFRESFPDVRMETLELIAEGAKVMGRFTCSATHLGHWMGHPPTGRQFEHVAEVNVYTLHGGRIVDTWSLEDNLDRLTQLGLPTTP